jgi:hypothetical protein
MTIEAIPSNANRSNANRSNANQPNANQGNIGRSIAAVVAGFVVVPLCLWSQTKSFTC